jgi:fructoselysine 6-kinase
MNIAFVGDLTVDRYPEQKKILLGGSSLNSAMWVKKFQAKNVSIVAAVGNDKEGDLYLALMKKNHINGEGISVLSGKTSSLEVYINSKTGERMFKAWDPGVLRQYHLGKKEFDLFRSHDTVVLTVYGKTRHLLAELSKWARKTQNHSLIVVNFNNMTQVSSSIKIVSDHIDAFDIGFFGLHKEKDVRMVAKLQKLAQQTGKLIVITLGNHGAVAQHGNIGISSPATHIDRVIDTTGAGDAFLAGFMVEYLKTNNVQRSLVKGNSLGARVIQMVGAY